MKLLSVELSLFRQHASSTVTIPDGLTGIVGANGSGKTTIVEAIGFALFGSKALRGRIEDVRTRSAIVDRAVTGERVGRSGRRKQDNEPKVVLILEQDGVVFRIERTLTDAALYIGGESQPVASGNRDVTNKVSSIVGMAYDEFVATYLTEQKGLEFLSGKKGATEREKFIVRMMGYDRLEEMQELVRDDRKEKRAILSGFEASAGNREELEVKLAQEKAEESTYREKHDEASKGLQKAEQEADYHKLRFGKLEEVKARFTKQMEVVNTLSIRIEERSRRWGAVNDGLLVIDRELTAFEKEIGAGQGIAELEVALLSEAAQLETEANSLQSSIREKEILWREGISAAEAELTALIKANETLEKRLTQIKKLRSEGDCPTCGQPLAESFEKTQQHFKDELALGSSRIKELQVRVTERKVLPVEVLKLKDSAAGVEARRLEVARRIKELTRGKNLQERRAQLEREKDILASEQVDTEHKLEDAKKALVEVRFSEEEYNKTKGSFEVAQRVVELARLQRVKLEGELNMRSALVERTATELRRFDERQVELEKLRREIRLLDESDRILTEFRKHINSLIRPRLAELASEYLADLTDGRYTALELGDDFTPTVLEDGESKPIISGGEQDILNLCMRLALSHMLAERAGQQFSLLLLDEIFGSLDEGRRGNVLALLEKLRKRFEQIVIITHLDDIKEGVQRLIQVEYDDATGAANVYDANEPDWFGGIASNF